MREEYVAYTTTASPLGVITLASDGVNLTGLWLEGQKYHGRANGAETRELPVFDAAKQWLDRYFAGEKPSAAALPLAPVGSEFRQAVWELLRAIPYGSVTTYGAIAETLAARLGKQRMASQAVGGAVGHNPISIIIPCHRVVGTNGSLTGYAGGIAVKKQLLEFEGVAMAGLFVPKRGTAL